MKIGIIGTGAIGGTIAKKLANAGHAVKVYSQGSAEKLKNRAQELGAAYSTEEGIVKDVEVLILSVPTIAIPGLSKLFTNMEKDVIVVDTSNYYPFRDADIEELKNGKVESVWVAEQIGRTVIKAFNNLLAYTLEHGGKSEGDDRRIAMAVSGDDEKAKTVVAKLVNDAGYDVVDAGSLAESWRHQPGTPAYCTELDLVELKQALADGVRENAADIRDTAINTLMKRATYPSHEEVVEFNRSLFLRNPKSSLS